MVADGRSISREVLEAYRLRAMALRHKRKYSVRQIAEIFGIHYNSVSRWFCKERRGGAEALKRTFARGASPKLHANILEWLSHALTKPATEWGFDVPLWNCAMVRTLLARKRSISLNRTTIWRALCRLGLTYQKPEKRYMQQNQELVKQWLTKEWPKIRRWVRRCQAILYFEDESGISLAPVVGQTWAPKGHPPIIRVTGKRGGLTAMSAISPAGHLRFRLERRRINAAIMQEFFEQILATHPRRKIGVVMDQAPAHIAKRLKRYVMSVPRIKVFHIPPYSPELNPDEKVWRHLKHVELKNHTAQNKEQLTRVVLAALRRMQKKPEQTRAFFRKMI